MPLNSESWESGEKDVRSDDSYSRNEGVFYSRKHRHTHSNLFKIVRPVSESFL